MKSKPNRSKKRTRPRGRRPLTWLIPVGMVVVIAAWWFVLRPAPRPNIVLITLESVRPDHLGCYGYDRPTSPALDSLAADGMVYQNVQAVSSWTLAAHTSMFTGLYPDAHRVIGSLSRLDDRCTTLAEILTGEGYQCAGVVSGPYLKRAHGLHQGFAYYDESASANSRKLAHAKVTCPEMESGLRRFITRIRNRKQPFFLFAYFWDPHYDYIPPEPFNRTFVTEDCEPIDIAHYEVTPTVSAQSTPGELAYVVSQYDGEIRWTDQHLARFFQLLKASGLWENTAIIVTADHGEDFFEHGQKGHKNDLYVESLHVPLIIKMPHESRRGHDARLASQVDIFPTILELAKAETEVPYQGISLLAPPPPSDRPIFFELLTARYFPKPDGGWTLYDVHNWHGVQQGDYKYVNVAEEERNELYDHREDPAERKNLYGEPDTPANTLLSLLQSSLAADEELAQQYGTAGEATLDQKALENLRSLGYVQ